MLMKNLGGYLFRVKNKTIARYVFWLSEPIDT